MPTMSVNYYVRIFNDTGDDLFHQIYYGDQNATSFGTSWVFANTSFNISINPFDGTVNGTYNYTTNFTVTNDIDGDTFSVLDSYKSSDSWDCNDTNRSVHQPKNRENDTSDWSDGGDGTTFCFNAVDDDCDAAITGYTTGGIDWLDHGCGHGFNPAPFDPALYINGSIRNISTSELLSGGYYVLINNTYGMIEYDTETDLTGVDLGAIFTITNNSIRGNPAAAYGDRFNKPAKVTFKSLGRYKKVPVVLVDGVICPPEICTNQEPGLSPTGVYSGNVAFTASHFSTFTTANNSRMVTFTQNESQAGTISSAYPESIETYHRVKFFANYTRFTDGLPINNRNNTGMDADVRHNGTCSITLIYPDGTAIPGSQDELMEYNEYYGVYWYEAGIYNFTLPSDYYRYNISCNSSLYEPINASLVTFRVTDDVTPPIRPVLYPQILLYPSNLTTNPYTWVAGYFNESDINWTVVVLHGFYTYNFTKNETEMAALYSEYKGDDIIVNFDSNRGENVTFTAWNPEIERALQNFRWVEFSNHNRSYFDRYYIVRANRTGDDIRVEFNETLDEDVDMWTFMRLYTQPHHSGYFKINVSLFGGSNRISAWGVDQAGNPGNATHDWINAPYPATAPSAPEIWPLPEAFKYDDNNLTVIGFINETSLVNLNMSLNFVQGYNFSTMWDNESFNSSYLMAEAPVTGTVPAGNNFFYMSDYDFTRIDMSANFSKFWVEFSNHNRTYWLRYNVTNVTNNPGEDARIYINPPLEQSVGSGVQAYFYNASVRQGWFNISVNKTTTPIWNGSNQFYAVAFRYGFLMPIEGYPSEVQLIYQDKDEPQFDLTGIPGYSPIRTPAFSFNVSDDYKVDISSLLVNVSNATAGWSNLYASDSSSFPGFIILQNISCTDLFANKSLYQCSFDLNWTENGTYDVNVSVFDLAGLFNWSNKSMTIQVDEIDVLSVLDEDDITNDAWLYFNWTLSGGELNGSEFALGTAPYPEAGFDSIKPWNSSCHVLGDCAQTWINFTHDMNLSDINSTELKMMTGTVYYLTVRARNRAGEYGAYGSSDGILFIDQTPPEFRHINDHGPWTDDDTSLSAEWLFEDNESDIIEYMYTLGTAKYPDPGYNSVKGQTLIGLNTVVNDGLDLAENQTYYYNVKARNGNVAMNYSGSWSPWYSSPGITVDTYPPYGGFIYWQNQTYATSGFVTLHFNVGEDLPGTSDNVKGMIEAGRGLLVNDICPSISDFDWINTSSILAGEGYNDTNVTTGYCYVFRLYAWDNATNGVTYHTTNETLKIIKADSTPPSDVAPVVDDGFYTNSRTSLHADWQDSYDAESGFERYEWKIYREPTFGGAHCVVNRTDPIGTNCSFVAGGNSSASEVSINTLNLTHNHKYYFEVRAWNRAGLKSTTRYSDGIIYIDNAPPAPVTIYLVNEDDESSSPYLTEVRDGQINITAYGDLDGYNDIAACVLMTDNIDYTEDTGLASVLSMCSVGQVWSDVDSEFSDALTNYTPELITRIDCTNYTNYTGGDPTQEVFTWYISCRDHYWNTQSYGYNTPVWFEVDWPEPPMVDVQLGDFSLATPVYSDDDLYCYAELSDPEEDLNTDDVKIEWYRNGNLLRSSYTNAAALGGGLYYVMDMLDFNQTFRGNSIECYVNATDSRNQSNRTSASVIVSNTGPYDLYMTSPDEDTVSREMTFTWYGPYDAVDDDFMTLIIETDNETGFNMSDNPEMAFGAPVMLNIGGSEIPGLQRDPDIYRSRVVYEDLRTGSNWDVYLYDMESDSEIPVATSVWDELNPKVYGDVIIYERENGFGNPSLFVYDITSSVTAQVAGSVLDGRSDLFGDRIVYNDGAGVKMKLLSNLSREISIYSPLPAAANLAVYGTNTLWTDASNIIWMNDASNSSSVSSGLVGAGRLFGHFIVNEDSGAINITNLLNGSVAELQGSSAAIYGNKLAYVNSSGGISIADLFSSDAFNVSLGMLGSNPDIYDKIVVFDDGSDIWYARQNLSLRSRFMVEQYMTDSGCMVDTRDSPDDGYAWRIQGCDNAFDTSSCVWGRTLGDDDYALFTVDNTPPVISSLSPAQGSVVAGQFRLYANIVDNLGADAVTYANYTLTYKDNGTIREASTMTRSGTVWNSSILNFNDINVSEFTLLVQASDFMDNWVSASVNFTVNNNTPWFLFGTGDEEIIENTTVFNATIDSDFVAFTVLASTIRIVGPLPATTVRFIQSKTNTTITNHNYSDPISTLTWPEGSYRAEFNGTNLDGSNSASRTFWVDRTYPRWSDATTLPSPAFAGIPLTLSIYWNDTTLRQVNISYNNTHNTSDSAPEVYPRNTTSSGTFTATDLDVGGYINRTFYWWSTAKDGKDRVNQSDSAGPFSVFVESDPPVFSGSIASITLDEDTARTSGLPGLAAYFTDPNTAGPWAYLDNLTFSASYDPTNLSIAVDATTGQVINITAKNNFNGNMVVYFNATDHYGKMGCSNPVTIVINPVNDAPAVAPIPEVVTEEDNSSGVNYSLAPYASDVDGDPLTWQMPLYNASVFGLTGYDLNTGDFNFSLKSDQFGLYNITFKVTDGHLVTMADATVNITDVNDAPVPGSFTAPPLDSVRKGNITIAWAPASDQANEGQTLIYYLAYSTTGGAPWTEMADYAVLQQNTTYSWDSIAALGAAENNITLRLNVSDGTDTSDLVYGNFTADSLAPQITINSPTTVMVGSSFTTDVTTHEPADCTFLLNGASKGSTSGQTSHQILISGLAYNVTYNLSITCTDAALQSAAADKLFEARASSLEFVTAYATPSWTYQGADNVNITIVVASNNTVTGATFITRPDAGTDSRDVATDFDPDIYSDNKYSYLVASAPTGVIGKYNFTIDSLSNTHLTITADMVLQDMYEVFEAVNQTLNVG
ncbi:hypothetical protein JW898_00820 [Candidatus Woesearchaeota archaeon]|nr:hypothetical protein [Candidatus Woesearchaeota archaeon]